MLKISQYDRWDTELGQDVFDPGTADNENDILGTIAYAVEHVKAGDWEQALRALGEAAGYSPGNVRLVRCAVPGVPVPPCSNDWCHL